MRKVRKTEIIYPLGVVKKLSENHGVSEKSVRNALRFVTQSDTAEAIRRDCLENYGGRLTELFI